MKTDFVRFRTDLLGRVGKRLGEYDFKARPNSNGFERQFGGGRQGFHLAFVKHKVDFDVYADVAIRFDALEDLITATATHLSSKKKIETYSIGATLGNISGESDLCWTVAKWTDVEPVAEAIITSFLRFGLPYLERYSD